jgi:hypothetical protein
LNLEIVGILCGLRLDFVSGRHAEKPCMRDQKRPAGFCADYKTARRRALERKNQERRLDEAAGAEISGVDVLATAGGRVRPKHRSAFFHELLEQPLPH